MDSAQTVASPGAQGLPLVSGMWHDAREGAPNPIASVKARVMGEHVARARAYGSLSQGHFDIIIVDGGRYLNEGIKSKKDLRAAIVEILQGSLYNIAEEDLNKSFGEMGIESLGRLDLEQSIEITLGIEIRAAHRDNFISANLTLDHLVEYLADKLYLK